MSDFYEKALKQCELYLGDRSKKFLDRQIEAHLSKASDAVAYSDKEELAKWVQISSGLILGATKAQVLAAKIRALTPG